MIRHIFIGTFKASVNWETIAFKSSASARAFAKLNSGYEPMRAFWRLPFASV